MTQVIGCGGSNSDGTKKNPSEEEIVDKFNEFIDIFPSDDLSFLFDKEGHVSSVDGEYLSGSSDLHSGDRGSWIISSYLDTKNNEELITFGVVLKFNRNTNLAKGNLILNKGENKSKYPIYYKNGEIFLVNEKSAPRNIKEQLDKFKIMYEFIELDRSYIDKLENVEIMYNSNAPIFNAIYKLKSNDKNVNKIKSIYPELVIDEENCSLNLYGRGTPWSTTGEIDLIINLDKNHQTYLTASMSFDESDIIAKESIDE